jgi:pimeloyl-ACP methyl ester carboxylesterase
MLQSLKKQVYHENETSHVPKRNTSRVMMRFTAALGEVAGASASFDTFVPTTSRGSQRISIQTTTAWMQHQRHRTCYSFWCWVLILTATTTTKRTIPAVVAFSGSLLRLDVAVVATRDLVAVTRCHYRRRRATSHLATAVGSISVRMTSSSIRECSSSRSMVPETISLTCTDGIVLTGQSYQRHASRNGDEKKNAPPSDRRRRILCLHGWMDNCRSYYYFAPHLLEQLKGDDHDNENDVHLVALDFPGHGRSDHFGPGRPGMVLAELIVYVAEALRALGWTTHHGHSGDNGGDAAAMAQPTTKNITLVGHSMGAAVACLYAASFPEQIDKLVLLEGVGPLARPALDAAKHVRKHVEKRLLSPTLYAEPRRYENLELAVAARCRTARTWPGNQYLSETAARQLVEYGTKESTSTTGDDDIGVGTTITTTLVANYYYQFRHDPRLQWPSLQFFTQEQTDGVYKDIQCPTALILAADGWPFDESTRRRTMELLRPVHTVTLPGSHHWHMDPDTAPAVVEQAAAFLRSSVASAVEGFVE